MGAMEPQVAGHHSNWRLSLRKVVVLNLPSVPRLGQKGSPKL